MPTPVRPVLLTLAFVACAATPPKPVDAASADAPPSPDGAPTMSTPEALVREHLARTPTARAAAIAHPSRAVGAFQCFRVGDDGPYLYASDAGVLTPDGGGDWRGFLTGATVDAVAKALVRMHADQRAGLLSPADPPPPDLSPADWSVVQPPSRVDAPDGSVVFTLWMGVPPRFKPFQLTVTAPPTGRATIARAP